LLAGVAGLNSAGGKDVCLLCVVSKKIKKAKYTTVKKKERSTDEVRAAYKRILKKKNSGGGEIFPHSSRLVLGSTPYVR
jgi:hypothetical protein